MASVVSGVSGIDIPALQAAYTSLLTENVTLIRKTITTDGTGMQTDTVSLSIPIICRIMPVSDKTRTLEDFGQAMAGESVGYFQPTYTYLSVVYTVTVDDLIQTTSATYRVQRVLHSQHIGSNNIYIKTALKLI